MAKQIAHKNKAAQRELLGRVADIPKALNHGWVLQGIRRRNRCLITRFSFFADLNASASSELFRSAQLLSY